MDLSLADLSDNDDSEYEENGCHDQMWDKMNDVLQEVILTSLFDIKSYHCSLK